MDWVCSGCGRHYNWTVTECFYCQPCVTVTTGGTQPTDTQQANATCNCVVKRTEVAGMGIIYARADCPIHGQFHGARC